MATSAGESGGIGKGSLSLDVISGSDMEATATATTPGTPLSKPRVSLLNNTVGN